MAPKYMIEQKNISEENIRWILKKIENEIKRQKIDRINKMSEKKLLEECNQTCKIEADLELKQKNKMTERHKKKEISKEKTLRNGEIEGRK